MGGIDQPVDAPLVVRLGGQEQACRADGKNGIVDRGGDAARDAHGDGKAKCKSAGSDGGPSGKESQDQEWSGGDFDEGGDHREGFGEAIRQEMHELVSVSGEVFPVTPADPGLSVGPPGSEPVESDDKKTCSKGEAEVELGKRSEHIECFFPAFISGSNISFFRLGVFVQMV